MGLEFKPFRQIPHDYHYEGITNPNLITAQKSVLISDAERQILLDQELLSAVENGTKLADRDLSFGIKAIWHISRYLNSTTSGQMRGALNGVLDLCSSVYPQSYEAVALAIQSPFQSVTAQNQKHYAELSKVVDHEYKPPRNLRLRFLFQDHYAASDLEERTKRGELVDELRGFFKPGEQNIMLNEDPTGEVSRVSLFQKGLKLYKTLYGAYAYLGLRVRLQREPTSQEVKGFYPTIKGMQDRYGRIICDVSEELQAEYDIKFIFEGGRKNFNLDMPENPSIEQWRQAIIGVDKEATARNKVIISQLEEVEEDVASAGKPTNVFVLLGTNHVKLLGLLPMRLSAVSTSITHDRDIGLPYQNELGKRLRLGLPIDDTLWELAYAEDLRR